MAGKGLAAASQVAMVRNILRYALLNAATVSEGVENANRTIAAHEMLLGFATLFVACYDAQSQLLSYVNYGQEAGVLIRASDTVIEALPATGPVFGLLNMGSVPEVTVSLHTGDVVAVFTDGLTEIGPSRKEMLENAGMARIIASYSRLSSPKEILAHAISDVTEFARGIVRDDQCLLIALATD